MEIIDDITNKIVQFVTDIGITISIGKVPKEKEFLPGICVHEGGLLIDLDTLSYPGDILHEAAHLAVASSSDRLLMDGVLETNTDKSAGEEMMAIAWSYAAAIHLKIDPHIVFHEHGYKGGGATIVKNFTESSFFGLPLLQWVGLTLDDKNAAEKNLEPYPKMLKWLRD
jgi:hypothetical protein